MANTRRNFFANGLATPLKVSICAFALLLLLHPAEILDPHANANSYYGLSCSNGGRSLGKAMSAQLGDLEDLGDLGEVGGVGREGRTGRAGRAAKAERAERAERAGLTENSPRPRAHSMSRLSPPKNMGSTASTSTSSHIPTKPKAVNQRNKHFCTSDEALSQLRHRMNSYINRDKQGQTKNKKGNIKPQEKIKNNIKLSEREIKKQMDALHFYVNKKDMYKMWEHIYGKRRHIYIDMIKTLWEKCVHLTEKKQIPKKFLFKVWWKAYSDFVVELQNFDSQNVSSFYDLYYKDRCSRYTYVQFIMENKKAWKEFTARMKGKWTNRLLGELRAYSR
ncbi:Plasmodium exported protein (PHISTc), unknown function [Plasmodium vivax]|nr:Plasmodium exported protein (PHISTc), unknown function [Plasmodium vivax]